MKSGKRGAWLTVVVLLAAVGVVGLLWTAGTHAVHDVEKAHRHALADTSVLDPASPMPSAPGQDIPLHAFRTKDVQAFLAAARTAEAIDDPLDRCLHYPDPPGSHWSPAATRAYCHYQLQAIMSSAQAQSLIHSGHADELDRQLAAALHAQFTQPEKSGLLDRTYYAIFHDGSFTMRATLDAWKRASPQSAFAFAASGFAYEKMAFDARGNDDIGHTPQSHVDAMEHLLQLADSDLQRAVALNPKVTPAYVGMIDAGYLAFGRAYVRNAARQGLSAAPDDYSIYSVLSIAAAPQWGGSLPALWQLGERAQQHIATSPMLEIIRSAAPIQAYDVCNCFGSANWEAFPRAFDHLGSASQLLYASYAAINSHHDDLAVIYLSEHLRFQPDDRQARRYRNGVLTRLGQVEWALADANAWIDHVPDSAAAYLSRAEAEKAHHDYAAALVDFERVSYMNPRDSLPLREMADIYLQARQWSEAERVSTRMVQGHALEVPGWVIRATAQRHLHSPDLANTVANFHQILGRDPRWQAQDGMLASMLAAQKAEAARATPSPIRKTNNPQ